MANVFISYSSKDTRQMMAMREQLVRGGFRPWVDPEPRPGNDWRFAIDEAIRASDAMVVIVTPNATDSVYVTYEWAAALAWGITVVPVVFAPSSLHPRLETLQVFDVNGFRDPAHFWDYFIREFQRVVRTPPPVPMPVTGALGSASRSGSLDRSVMPPSSGYWLVMRRGDPVNMMWQLTGQTVTLGRDVSNDVGIDNVGISRFHCRFSLTTTGYMVEDLKSTNGVVMNGARIQGVVSLPRGAILQFGEQITLTYEVV